MAETTLTEFDRRAQRWVEITVPNAGRVVPGSVEFVQDFFGCSTCGGWNTFEVRWNEAVTRRGPKYHGEPKRRTYERDESRTYDLSGRDLTQLIRELLEVDING